MRLIRLVPFALVFGSIPACGGTAKDDVDEGPSVSLEELPAKYADAFCQTFTNCVGDLYGIYRPGEECVKDFTVTVEEALATLPNAVDAGRVKYHGTKVQKCLDEMAAGGCASTLALEMSDGGQRLVVNCGGPGLAPSSLPFELVQALRSTAAHSTLVLDDTNSTAILPDGSLGKGVMDVEIARSEDNDCSRLEASHDGYVKGFGLVHQRRLSLGNDGKEVRGEDRLVPKGRRKIRESAPFAIRFHLAPGIEATVTADGMGAILRSSGAPPWNFRCRGAMLQVEESLFIDGRAQPQPTLQLVVVGEISGVGGEIAWQFRRSS